MLSPLIVNSELNKTRRNHIYIDKHGKKSRTTIELENYYCDALQDAFGITSTELKKWLQDIADTWDKNDARGIGGFVKYEIVKALTLALLDERKIKSSLASTVTSTPSKKFVRSSSTPRTLMTAKEKDAFMMSEMPDYYLLELSDLSLSVMEQEAKHNDVLGIIVAMNKKVSAKALNFIGAVGSKDSEMSIFLKIAIIYVIKNPSEISVANLKAHFMDGMKNGAKSYTIGTSAAQATNCISLFEKLRIIVENNGCFELNPESLLLAKTKLKLNTELS